MSQLEFIIAVEQDPESLSVDEYVNGMAGLLATNMIRHLQGSWQRAAQHLVDAGIVDQYGKIDQGALDAVEVGG